MAIVTFEKLSDHNAMVGSTNRVVWRIRLTDTIDEYYIRADQAHSKLGGGYWAERKHLILIKNVRVAQAFEAKGYETPMPAHYLDITCGNCGIVNSLNIDTIQEDKNQGAHHCKSCRATIVVVIGIRINLQNGSKSGNVVRK